jgi:hypothetical protein
MRTFGGDSDSVGNGEEKNVRLNTRLLLNSYRHRAVRIYIYKSTVNGNKERQITYC